MPSSRILIAEDSQVQQKIVATMLASHGIFNVSYASNGREVLVDIRHWGAPELLLLDLHMPEIDGIDLLYELSGAGFDGDIILMSSRDRRVMRSAVRIGLSQGLRVIGALQKPIDERKLIEFIRNSIPLNNSGSENAVPRFTDECVIGGLSNDEFNSYFQPIIGAETGELIALEALSRWHHPDYGTLTASEFLPLTLHHSIISRFYFTALKNTVSDFVENYQSTSEFSLSINFDPAILRTKADVSEVLDIVTSAGLAPERLVLELSSTQVERMQSDGADLVNHLNLKGFRVALQDFGASSSALSQVADLPVTMVKISSRFVRAAQEDDVALTIFQSLVDMSRKLGIDCVATGIETVSDWDLMKRVGCDLVQGFLICKPKPIEQFNIWASGWDRALINQNH